MPTILRINGFRFYFYSHEPNEPAHIHVDRAGASVKVWLHDVSIARSIGFTAKELREVQKLVGENQVTLQEAWNAYFAN